MKTCLTIAGSDSSGGAGIQADLKTFAAHRVYGMSAITAVTAQNTLGVHHVSVLEPGFVGQQIDAVFKDIRPDAVKIGMLGTSEIIQTVADRLTHYQAENVVLDPVMVATSGNPLLDDAAIDTLIQQLIPLSHIITPNVPELIALSQALGCTISQNAENERANNEKSGNEKPGNNSAENQIVETNQSTLKSLSKALFNALRKLGNGNNTAILSKGGHLSGDVAADFLITEHGASWLNTKRIQTNNTHGTGCTLSAAICAQLATDQPLAAACAKAKDYLSNALAQGLNLGQGNGPLNHLI